MKYSYPVNKFIVLGKPATSNDWKNYLEMGISEKDVPELIQMLKDEELLWADQSSIEIWAPVHAWRTLGQLKAKEAIEPLLALLKLSEKDEWIDTEIPTVLAMIGPDAIPQIEKFLDDPEIDDWTISFAAIALEKIAEKHEAYKAKCVEILTKLLENYEKNTPELNGLIISNLEYLKAVESIDVIEKAYKAEKVDLSIHGDWEDVQMNFGLIKERKTPAKNYIMEKMFGEDWEKTHPLPDLSHPAPHTPASSQQKKTAASKNKRKQAKQSRKKNRKKKKR